MAFTSSKTKILFALCVASTGFGSSAAHAAATVTMNPLTTFGTNGWLAPGAIPQLDTSNSQRGMAVVPTTGNLVLVDRDLTLGNNAYVISGATGIVNGTLTPPSGGPRKFFSVKFFKAFS